jgi:HK97 family phage prohead protease
MQLNALQFFIKATTIELCGKQKTKKMAKSFPFTVHDESLNSHGFRMLTSGAILSVFRENPVMLLNHNDWETPVGRWENIRTEGPRILADAVFDEGDETGAKIMGKVERGFLKACSVGARVIATSSDPSLMLPGQQYPTVTEWELREISVCTIGANHNALALYDMNDNLIDGKKILELFDASSKGVTRNGR